MKFNSQIATSRSQSERLLSLGLKKETADMVHYNRAGAWRLSPIEEVWDMKAFSEYGIPAWSLGRLLEMMPYCVEMYNSQWCLQVSKEMTRYAMVGKEKSYIGFFQRPNTYDAVTDSIEWLIKEGYFNKEYLEE